ncbi:kelch repeat-containing protein [Quercus suber]|uniref:Kelch repeat-containing protein n=1 Tax=Quercus suber TaxID=58331 RepID=A0AAW0LPI9_QUESU
MVRPSGKHGSARLVVICVSLLGLALIADFLWASSSSSSNSAFSSYHDLILPSNDKPKQPPPKKKEDASGRVLSATFADLPGPELKWEKMAASPVPRLDGAAIQIKNLLYVFAGYGTIDYVHSHVDIYNFTDNTWGGRFDMPKEMAHSHLGMVTDGRYVYVVTGQYGPQCRGPTAHTFVLDTETKQWRDMPPLPVPRYAPATQLWRGRLHVMGGSKENRYDPALEHWSLAVKDGKALEKEWRTEIAIPRGGPHRACIVADDQLYVIGGQEGDFMAKPGSPIFKCSRRNEVVFGNVYMLDDEMKWKELPPMPKPDSHIEFAWVFVNNSFVIVGGTTDKHPVTKKMVLNGEVFQFNLGTLVVFGNVYMLDDEMKWKELPPMPKPDSHIEFAWVFVNNSFVIVGGTTDKHPITKKMVLNGEVFQFNLGTLKWSVIGKLPFRVKTTLVGYWNGWLYFTSGQKDKGPNDPAPKKVIGDMYRTKLKLSL